MRMSTPRYKNLGVPRPLCLTCGVRQVRKHVNKYCCKACVPRSVLQQNGGKGGPTRRFRNARRKFEAIFARLTAGDRVLTKARILEAFSEVDLAAYQRGFW
jgi:hypothetical protein